MKFKGILLASDWDNTLFCKGEVSKENQEAIRYFQKEGGLFTVCSGRNKEFIDKFKDIVRPNTYSITYNGACIYHLDDKKMLYEAFVDEKLFDIIDNFIVRARGEIVVVIHEQNHEPQRYSVNEYKLKKSELMQKNIYKCVIVSDNNENGLYNKIVANELELYDYYAVRSWATGLEFFKKCNSKGSAIKRVAEAEGVKLTIGAGDFENDIELLEKADIGYAVGNAIDEVRNIADRITVSCDASALAAIIYEIENDIDSGKIVL